MPKEMRKGKISEPNLEEQGIFPKRFKSHNDSVGIVSDYFRKNKKFGTEAELLERMQKPAENELGTIYVHTPYCDKICSFCNLNRKQIDNDLEDYTNFLVSEFEKYGKTPYMKSKKINVIFFGGGTPTIYKEHQLERILKAINDNFTLTDEYDYIVIDGSPVMGLDNLFIEISDHIVIPTFLDSITTHSVLSMLKKVDLNKVKAVVPNRTGRTKLEKEYYDFLNKKLGVQGIHLSFPIPEISLISKLIDKETLIWESKSQKLDYVKGIFINIWKEIDNE